ncbi:hypothetical protein OVY01_14435 [Robbsia sp. Bb-Pol-6]|uniref:Uncharacterized protein n=1 Tax=Robbsia betulipollinis TaxID=2981849 RepID=A0ABT3ZPK0_9BURK|nr:hypothetical protein [Robbsia betulipollinis]MCY0388407.1 hypothetical protein [Robbsia betulipollinis]
MDASDINARFAELAKDSDRSLAMRFRDVFDAVEHSIKSGVSRAQARDELAKMGLDIAQPNFNMLLVRIRKERRKVEQSSGTKSEITQDRHATSSVEKTPAGSSVSVPRPKPSAKLAEYVLPEDWLTAELPPEVLRGLSLDQKSQRRKARDKFFHPSPFDLINKNESKGSL